MEYYEQLKSLAGDETPLDAGAGTPVEGLFGDRDLSTWSLREVDQVAVMARFGQPSTSSPGQPIRLRHIAALLGVSPRISLRKIFGLDPDAIPGAIEDIARAMIGISSAASDLNETEDSLGSGLAV